MTQQQVMDWCTAHVAAPVSSSTCDAFDDPKTGGYYIRCITYKNGDTYKHTERGPWYNATVETWINGELVYSFRGRR